MAEISIRVAGRVFRSWTRVTVTRSLRAVCGTFEMESSDLGVTGLGEIKTQMRCVIEVDGVRVLTGRIDRIRRQRSATSAFFVLNGRDLTADLVDCSVLWPPPNFSAVTLLEIAEALCAPFKIPVKLLKKDTEVFPMYQVNKGERVHECILRAATMRRVWCTTDSYGNLVLTSVDSLRRADPLRGGENILAYDVLEDFSNRYSEIQVHPTGDILQSEMFTRAQGGVALTLKDAEVSRHRPLLVMVEPTTMGVEFMRRRMQFEQQVRKGESQTVSVRVPGWTQSNGDLWTTGLCPTVDIPGAVKGKLAVSEVAWDYSAISEEAGDGGATTRMNLVRVESLAVEEVAPTNPFTSLLPEDLVNPVETFTPRR